MQILDQRIEQVPLGHLKPHPDNPRQGDVGAIYQSIVVNGFYGAVVAQVSSSYVIAGNHRFFAARDAGATEIPVLWLDISDEHAKRILLADNRTSDLATNDQDALVRALQELAPRLEGTGYDEEDLDRLLKDLADPVESAPRSPTVHECPACGHRWSPSD